MPRAAISVATSTRTAPDLKSFKRAQPLVLRTIGMNRRGLDPAAFETSRDAIGAVFRARKNQHGIELRIAQQMQEQRRLEMLAHFVNELRHRLGRIRATADLDHFRRALELVRERFDFARKRRGKQQRLPFLRQRFHDLPDRRKKAHVEHPVGFIEHEKFDPGKIRVALSHQIEQPTRRGDDEIDAGAERLDLRTFAHAAENRRHAQRQMLRVGAHILLDLHDEFARRRDDQRAHPALLPAAQAPASWCSIGRVNAAVFPVPVCAMPMTS